MNRTITIRIVILIMGVTGFAVLHLLNTMSFDAPCDGHGPANGEIKHFYDNGKLKTIGTVRNCLWEGLVKNFYDSGELESIENYKGGLRNGLSEYFTKDSVRWRQENLNAGSLTEFTVTDIADHSLFIFKSDTLKFLQKENTNSIFFNKPITMTGYDEPFTSLHQGKLLMRGRFDFYVVNKSLKVELNLRDTLMKYIPSAYKEKVDNSGNKHTFHWHRRMSGDTLNVKVFYDANEHQSNHKIWETYYILWNKQTASKNL